VGGEGIHGYTRLVMTIIPAGPVSSEAPVPTGGVRLTWAPELAERLRAGMPLTVLGQLPLDPPLGHLLVLGRSDGAPGQRSVSLAAAIMPAGSAGALALAPFGLGPLAGALQPPAELRERFATRRTSEALFILDDEGRDRFAVGPGVVLNQLVVSCGTWPLLVPLFGPRTRSRPAANLAALEADLDSFCIVVGTTVDAIYRRQRVIPPGLALTIRPTGLNVDAALGGLRWLGKSAADLVSKLPKPVTGPGPTPILPRAAVTEVTPGASFEEVGGQEEAKRELQAICLAVRDPDAYRLWGARPPKGVLLYGPPGTGKTLLARCMAQEAAATFIHVRATDVTSKWYGEAERRVQQVFDRARREAPSVVFFDEIDAIARMREDSHEATHRVVSTLLENMDGLLESQGVIVIAATNRPEAVDPAILRPGRFDRLVEVPLPDRAGRRGIFRVHVNKAERQAGRELFEPLDDQGWQRLLENSDGFSGAEIAEVVRRVLEDKVRSGAREGQITLAELLDQARTITPRW
jgi:AAA+ superfamily predicted ATPase